MNKSDLEENRKKQLFLNVKDKLLKLEKYKM